MIWTRSQRRILSLCLLVFGVSLALRARRDSTQISDPPGDALRASELDSRLDPNTADWSAMASLPDLGEASARAIVEYRERVTRENPGQRAFRTLADLQKVKGIGPAGARNLAPYLRFPTDDESPAPASQPN